MSIVNINPKTGIRYGIISAASLDPDVIDQIQREGRDVRWEDARQGMEDTIRSACEGYMSNRDIQEVVDAAVDRMNGDNWYDDEPIHEFWIDGVEGQTTWLGGALLVWVFWSAHTRWSALCSPCVPNAGDLDSLPSGEDCNVQLCYDVPPDWRVKE